VKRLTANFTLQEFEESHTAARLGFDNRIPTSLIGNVERLAQTMQRIRNHLAHQIVIASGYRCAKLNAAINGAVTSHHRKAAAADWTSPGYGTPIECALAVAPHWESWGIGQLILEYASEDGRGWVHTGILPVKTPNQIISIDRHGARVGIHAARK
jgi:GNAT superfamily N-acetyltransferase